MDELFRNIRASASTSIWSKGVELARQEAVTGEKSQPHELKCRVKAPGSNVSPLVVLYPDDGDWQCSCGGDDDPCAHVTAAIIALKRARESGKELTQANADAGYLVYRFHRSNLGLELVRVVLANGPEQELQVSLTALVSGRVAGPKVAATSEDLEADLALGTARKGVLPGAVFPKLLRALQGSPHVTIDGSEVQCDAVLVGLIVEITDEGPGVRLIAKQDPEISELFKNGAALCGTKLRPWMLPQLSPMETQLIRDGRFFAKSEFGELLGVTLPGLEQKLPVKILARNLPTRGRDRPRIDVELGHLGEDLFVTPWIVYGPKGDIQARVENGKLTLLGTRAPTRMTDEELMLKDDLRRRLGLTTGETARFTGEEAVRFIQRLKRLRGHASGPGLAKFTLLGELKVRTQIRGSNLDIQFLAVAPNATEQMADPAQVLKAWKEGQSLVPLLGGGYGELPAGWLNRFGERVLGLLAARNPQGEIPKAAWPELAKLAEDLDVEVPPALAGLNERLKNLTHLPKSPLPSDLTATLRSYQQSGVDWLFALKGLELGALLADDMGLGKTLQAITVLSAKSLIVAPTSVVFNWQNELAKFRPGLKVAVFHGPGRTLDADADVTVTTYAVLRLDVELLKSQLWDTIVFDEAQALKNPESQAARAARRIQAKFRLAMSGTPVENRLEDLWSLMHLVNPGLLGDLRHFQDRYARLINAGDETRAAALRTNVGPFIMRRLKREVAPELPPRTDTVLHVELSPSEKEHYEIVRAAARKDVLEKLAAGAGMMEALEALLRLRQAACHPALLPGVKDDTSSKLELLIETLTETVSEGHKVLVFSQWTSFLDLIEPALASRALPFLRLDGATQDRAQVVTAFQEPKGPKVLLMSLKAGGVGLNLTAADHVIITDPWWNPAAEDQAADRAHRIGQERPVLVQRLVALGTVEERILALQERKRALAEAVVAGNTQIRGLTKDDLLALLD